MKYMTLILTASISFAGISAELAPADKEIIKEISQFCTEVAEEDGTGGQALNEFLLACVNQELTDEGYQALKSLEE